MDKKTVTTDVLVVGAGISGMTTALETAETGFTVSLIEKKPFVGGRITQLNEYFPKLCPPTCGLEINLKRMQNNSNIGVYTMAEVLSVSGEEGDYKVEVKITPRYVKENGADIEAIVDKINIERDNDFNFGLDKTKVVYLPYNNCYPQKYVLDKEACNDEDLKFLADNYSEIIDLDQQEEIIEFNVKAIVWATGWDPYDASNLETLGYKEFPNVVTNMEIERMAAPSGPTGGQIKVPGTDMEIKKVAFVQCAGSRDENHLEYCSSICCLASMKEATYVRKQFPDSEVHIFYIDLRAYGTYEEFYNEVKKDEKIFFHRGKVAKVIKSPDSDRLIVEAEDTMAGELTQAEVDLVVLATGMKPTSSANPKIDPSLLDRNGFVKGDLETGQVGCGVCTKPKDVAGSVQESTGTAIKAIHTIKGGE